MDEEGTARTYLQECCALSAALEPERILAMRRARRNGTAGAEAPPEVRSLRDAAPEREQVEGELERIREVFFDLESEELLQQLAEVDATAHADLARYHSRLRKVAAAIGALAKARKMRKVNKRFLETFKLSLIAPDEQRDEIRERVLEGLADRKRVRIAHNTALALEQHFPEVHDLDPHWLGQLVVEVPAKSAGSTRAKILWWIYIAVVVVSAIFGMISGALGDG